jgi:hypothetical protein
MKYLFLIIVATCFFSACKTKETPIIGIWEVVEVKKANDSVFLKFQKDTSLNCDIAFKNDGNYEIVVMDSAANNDIASQEGIFEIKEEKNSIKLKDAWYAIKMFSNDSVLLSKDTMEIRMKKRDIKDFE